MDHSDKNKIDSLFRESFALSNRQPVFVEEEWEMMESLLVQEPVKKNNIIWLYRLTAGIAAGLLLFIGIHFAVKNTDNGDQQIAVIPVKTDTLQHNATTINKPLKQDTLPVLKNPVLPTVISARDYTMAKSRSSKTVAPSTQPLDSTTDKPDDTITETNNKLADANVIKTDTVVSNTNLTANTTASVDTPLTVAPPIKNGIAKKQHSFSGPKITLAILAAPDVNGVNSFKGAQTGGNFSVQASVKLTSKLSVTTGAAYAIKPYETGFSNYRSGNPAWWRTMWAAKPQDVMANCKVLDIPLNLDYQLFKKGGNDFSVGAGVSSYFMLNERYSFAFADPSATPAQLQVSNRNQHLFGVFNIQATYQHKLNSRFGLLVQPYAKLPFSRIGLGQVNLKSAGVAVGFNWNIHSFNK
ncbi:outer membrane beta-barrel protein [Mucilaginibacter sp. CAU 1740]|uniref:outer membrane beta-barrel protein n=1 Tax=Mucilaginibacter sp. CAU 1740 TaxID=3140365 RepID=UPI00325A9299